ncbi:MAG: DUF2334 domain-containing protein [Lachnospiraceae bacterium]
MKKYIGLILFFFILFIPKVSSAAEKATIVVIYTLTDESKLKHFRILDIALNSFDVDVTFVQDTELLSIDPLEVDHLIYYGIDKQEIPETVSQLINTYPKGVYAIGHNVEQLERFEWLQAKPDTLADAVFLPNQEETYPLGATVVIVETSPAQGIIQASVKTQSEGGRKIPLLVQNEMDFYLSSESVNFPFDLFFCESLPEFLDQEPLPAMRYLRLEDIHPKSDPDVLMEQAKYLKEQGIPYMVAVIPVYVDTAGNQTHLSDSLSLVKTLQYMQENGASLILHGYRHQYRSTETGEGFEFWDAQNDQPIVQDATSTVKNRSDFTSEESYQEYLTQGMEYERYYMEEAISDGIEELVTHELYPLAFEAPHYAISEEGYQILSEHFTSYTGRLQLSNTTWKTEYVPLYASDPSYLNGMTVYPETLGYIEQGNNASLSDMQMRAELLSNFSQVYYSAFYHPYLGLDGLKEVVSLLQSKSSAEWLDLKKIDTTVKINAITITTSDGVVQVDKPFISGEYERNLLLIKIAVFAILGSIILVFIFLFLHKMN